MTPRWGPLPAAWSGSWLPALQVAVLVGAAVWVLGIGSPARRRLHGLPGRQEGIRNDWMTKSSVGVAGRPHPARSRWAAAAIAGVGAALVLGGAPGVLGGLAVVVVAGRTMARLEPVSVRRQRARVAADLAPAADLLVAAVRAGVSVDRAAAAVAEGIGGPLGAALEEVVVATTRLGADPVLTWAALGSARTVSARAVSAGAVSARAVSLLGPMQETARGSTPWEERGIADPAVAAFGRAVARALASGAALAPALERLAQDQRARRHAAAMAAASRVGVRAVGPLAVCFLPAFVLLSVVPVVVSVATTVLGDLG